MIKKDVSLADFTTFKIGGPARFFVEVETKEELDEAKNWAEKEDLGLFLLGGGSNILVSDDGFDGLVMKLANKDWELEGNRISCGAGAGLNQILPRLAEKGLSGLEWAAGIPGITLGGAVRGNAGAFGHYTSDVIRSVEVYDLAAKKWSYFKHRECDFGYRDSVFKHKRNLLIWRADLEFESRDKAEIKKDIRANTEKRNKGQPRKPSAGSVFKNFSLEHMRKYAPSLADRAQYEEIVKEGMVGAGWVIDQLDLGCQKIGGAQVSDEHANFIINTGQATALDVITLIGYIKQKVRDNFGLQLREEIQYVGF